MTGLYDRSTKYYASKTRLKIYALNYFVLTNPLKSLRCIYSKTHKKWITSKRGWQKNARKLTQTQTCLAKIHTNQTKGVVKYATNVKM